ncbi:GMP synthase-Glutamine amidotransferase [Raineyella antarctica]|uniref:GMP synthase-Glutamine amidotransferase n=1 Tax=Raineyella antarctica TaxID=1577474 RepID=A0A1G6GPH1_9ACTN|nr:type 1 glutamine amidotransferase [Raineyella antarctica]SDB83900.1 GMP synthase-Glutamine amidotransferase [Raineyella antarctica]
MRQSVLALVHGVQPGAEADMLGHLTGAFARSGHDVGTASFTHPDHAPRLRLEDLRMLVVMGSLDSCTDDSLPWLDAESRFVCAAIGRGIPVLGICFGAQLLARLTGGRVVSDGAGERGMVEVCSEDPERVPAGRWYAHHRDHIVPPPGAEVLASSESCVQAFAYGPHLGVQFHPEASPATIDTWRTSFYGTNASLAADDPAWVEDRAALADHDRSLATRTALLVRGFVRSAQRRLSGAV